MASKEFHQGLGNAPMRHGRDILKSIIACAAAAALSVIAIATVPAGAQQKLEFKFVSAAPPKTPWETQINRFRDDIAKETKGEVTMVPYINSVLGSEQDTILQVQNGRLESGGFSVTAGVQIVKEMSLLAAPYVWESEKQADCVLDNFLFAEYQKLFDKRGLVLTQWSEVGWVNVYGKKPLLTPADTKGYKVRVAPASSSKVFWDAVGANGVQLGVPDVNPSLQTGLVDGGDFPNLTYVAMGTGKLAPHLTLTQHQHQAGIVVFNKRFYERLPKDTRAKIELVSSPPHQLRTEVRGVQAAMLKAHQAQGGTVHTPTADQLSAWKKAAEPAQAALVKDIGGEAPRLWQVIQKAKKECPV
jgi:TRAP-type C4-dicarboxylate transport system substrate-binding protein